MVVDGRILWLELDGALELLDRLLHVAKPVIGPAEGVDDVTIVRALLDSVLTRILGVLGYLQRRGRSFAGRSCAGARQLIHHRILTGRPRFVRHSRARFQLRSEIDQIDASQNVPLRAKADADQTERLWLSQTFGAPRGLA
jgi:hypothetical protein